MLNTKNVILIKIVAILVLVVYFVIKAIPLLNAEPSGMQVLTIVVAAIGFSVALFTLVKDFKNAKTKNQVLTNKNRKGKLLASLNVLGILLVAFLLIANHFELIPKNYFVLIYILVTLVLLAIIILNFYKKKQSV